MQTLSAASAEIENRARSVLSSSPIAELRRLRIEKTDGVLCLLGSLSTWHHKQLAQETLRRLCVSASVPIRNLTNVVTTQSPRSL